MRVFKKSYRTNQRKTEARKYRNEFVEQPATISRFQAFTDKDTS